LTFRILSYSRRTYFGDFVIAVVDGWRDNRTRTWEGVGALNERQEMALILGFQKSMREASATPLHVVRLLCVLRVT
jgi:hypothetical protein